MGLAERPAMPVPPPPPGLDSWAARAQDGLVDEVLADVHEALGDPGLAPAIRVQVLYAQAIALHMVGRDDEAVTVAHELCRLCDERGLAPAGLRARALLIDFLRRAGRIDQAVQHLADAALIEPVLGDLTNPDVQGALAAFAVALRLSGVAEEAARVEGRLSDVEPSMPRHQRIARWSNLAFEQVVRAMTVARRPPYVADEGALRRSVEAIRRAAALVADGVYEVVEEEAAAITGLALAVGADPARAIPVLDGCVAVLGRGPEAVNAQLIWAAARVRALARLGHRDEALRIGRQVLRSATGAAENGTRRVLAYEVMRVENPACEQEGSGTAGYVQLVEQRMAVDVALVDALFRARLDQHRWADERRRLALAAALDPLTGLVNRRGASMALAEAADQVAGCSIALLLLDLDGFKEVNDNQGHLVGDDVLQQVASALRSAARADDVIARWGGDEFVVIAELDRERAVALAERLRDAIRDGEPGGAGGGWVSASVGVAVRTTPVDAQTWLRRADEAMYAAKRDGGDGVVLC